MGKRKKTNVTESQEGAGSDWAPKAVRKAIEHLQRSAPLNRKPRKLEDLAGTTNDDLEKILLAVALFDGRYLYREDGTGISLQELDDVTALALAGLEVEELWEPGAERGDPRVAVGLAKKYRINDRLRAIELVLRLRGVLDGGMKPPSTGLKDLIEAFRRGPVKKDG